MNPTVANLMSGGSTSDVSSYPTASFTVTSGKPVLFTVVSSEAGTAADTPTVTMAGVTATQIGSVTFIGGVRRITVFWLVGEGTGQAQIAFAGAQNGVLWRADEVTGGSTAVPAAADVAVAQASTSSPAADLVTVTSGNSVWAAIGVNDDIAVQPGGGFTELVAEQLGQTPALTLASEYRQNSDAVAPTFQIGTAVAWGVVAVELTAADEGGGEDPSTTRPSVANLLRSGSTTDALSYPTASFTVTSGKPVLFSVVNARGTASIDRPTVTPMAGVTATEIGTIIFVGGSRRLTLFWLTGSGTGQVTVTFPIAQTGVVWQADEVTGGSTTAPSDGDVAVAQASTSSPAAGLTDITAGNSVYAAVGVDASTTTVDPKTGFTKLGDVYRGSTPTLAILSEYLPDDIDAAPGFTLGTAAGWGLIAVELAAGASSSTWYASPILV